MSTTTDVPTSITTPDTVQTSLGTLEFRDGAPSADTADAAVRPPRLHARRRGVPEQLPGRVDRTRSARASSTSACEDNQVLMFSELMDSASLFLTANSDTVYFLGFVDLTDGPMVIDVPTLRRRSAILGTIDDMWFQLGHRLRPARPRSRRRRPVPARRARL